MVAIKILVIWLLMVVTAILNGLFREQVLKNLVSTGWSVPISGVILSILIFLIVYLFLPWLGRLEVHQYWLTGIAWLVLGLSFEFVFGYFVRGMSIQQILQVFNIMKGDLFILTQLTVLLSPIVAAGLRDLS